MGLATAGLLLAGFSGVVAGTVHVLTGPDHLAAVIPLAARARQQGDRRGFGVGVRWGLGHGLGVLVLAGLGMALRQVIDIDAVSWLAEVVVGAALLLLGVWTIRKSRTVVVHSHAHEHGHGEGEHGEGEHAHVHVHVGDDTVGSPEHARHGRHGHHRHGALAFGLLHGIAGTSHLVAALPALALGGWAAGAYVSGYLLAAVPLMALVGGAVVRLMDRPTRIGPVMLASGALAAVVGVVWLGNALLA